MSNLRPFLAVLGGFLIHLTLGAVYSWGNLSLYVISYIRNNGSPSIGKNISVWPFAMSLFGQSAFMPLGGLMERRFGAKITMAIGCTLLCASLFVTSLVCHNFVGLILVYGLLAGSGSGIAYSSPMSVCMKWLPKYKGLINGIIVGGFGLGSFVFSQIQLAIINPNKESPSDDGYYSKEQVKNVPKLFLVTGGIYVCLELVGWLMISLPDKETSEIIEMSLNQSNSKENVNKENKEKEINSIDILSIKSEEEKSVENELPISNPLSLHSSTIKSNNSSPTNSPVVDDEREITINIKEKPNDEIKVEEVKDHVYTVKEAIKSYKFWIIWLMFMGNGVAVSIMSSYWKVQGVDRVTSDDTFLTWTGSISSIFNAGGRIVWGELGDIIGQRLTCSILGIVCGILQFSFYYIRNKVLYSIYVCLSFFCFGGFFGMYPTMTAIAFKRKNFSIIYGLIFTSQIVSNLFSAVFSQILLDSIGLLGIFIMVGGFVSFALFLVLFYPSQAKNVKNGK